MDVAIYDVKSIDIIAKSLGGNKNDLCNERFHIQSIKVMDGFGNAHTIELFFNDVNSVMNIGNLDRLDQANSNEDYLGIVEVAEF